MVIRLVTNDQTYVQINGYATISDKGKYKEVRVYDYKIVICLFRLDEVKALFADDDLIVYNGKIVFKSTQLEGLKPKYNENVNADEILDSSKK